MDQQDAQGHPAAASPSSGLHRIAGYEILGKLGAGAMGAVFKARQESLDRVVALKILPRSVAKDSTFIERFQREARTSAKLVHPHIVQGIDVGCDPATGLWYFAMEFVDGQALSHLLKQRGVLPEEEALRIVRQVAEALVCAEKHGIVHRDIKPDNILMTSRGEAKLADLGLAKQTGGPDASLTQDGKAVGTPYYMAPEQARGDTKDLDIRTDLYALGATLFHLVTGEPPFTGETGAVIMAKHITAKPRLAHQVNPKVSEACGRLIGRLLQKNRAQRPASAAELIKQIDHLDARLPTTGLQSPVQPRAAVRGRPSQRTSDAPIASGRKSIWLYLGVGGGVALLLFISYFLLGSKPPPATQARPGNASPKSPEIMPFPETPKAQARPPEAQGGLKEQLAEIRAFAQDHPDAMEELRARYERLLEAARRAQQETLTAEIETEWANLQAEARKAREAAWNAAVARVEALKKEGDFDAALALLESLKGKSGTDATEHETRVAPMVQALHDDAEGRLAPKLTEIAALLQNGAFEEARAKLAALGAIHYAPFAEKLEALKVSLERARADAASAKAQASAGKQVLEAMLDRFDNALLKPDGGWPQVTAVLQAMGQEPMDEGQKECLAALNGIVAAREEVLKREQQGLRALVGQTVLLQTSKGDRKGEIQSIEGDEIRLEQPFIINGVKRGAAKLTVAFSELTAEQRQKLRGDYQPATTSQRLMPVLEALRAGALDQAEAALKDAGDEELPRHYRKLIRERRVGAAEVSAEEAWKAIEDFVSGFVAKKLDKAGGEKLLPMLADFEGRHAGTVFGKGKAVRAEELRLWAQDAVIGFSIHKLFNGRVESFNPDTLAIVVSYDFKDPKQLEDWESLFGQYTQTGSKLVDHAGTVDNAEIRDGKLMRREKGENFINTRAVYTGDMSFTFEVEGRLGNWGGGSIVYRSSESRRWSDLRLTDTTSKENGTHTVRASSFPSGGDKSVPLPEAAKGRPTNRFTLQLKGARLTGLLNGEVLIENWEPKDHKGSPQVPAERTEQRAMLAFESWRGANDGAVTFARIEGVLQQEWLEQQTRAFKEGKDAAPPDQKPQAAPPESQKTDR